MAITQRLLNLDQYFRTSQGEKILVNDLNLFTSKDSKFLENNIKTVYNNTDVLSVKAACACGKLSGTYLVGKHCNYCDTVCKEPGTDVSSLFWLKAISEEALFVNPIVWCMIRKILGHRKIDYLRYLCDVKYNPSKVTIPVPILDIRDKVLGGERDYVKTTTHLKEILIYLQSLGKNKNTYKQEEISLMIDMLNNCKSEIYSHYLPIISPKLYIIENTTKGRYIDLSAADIESVVKTWSKLCTDKDRLTPKQISSYITTVMSTLADLYTNYFGKSMLLASKKGIFRKHVYGTRSHFTFRCVIISVDNEHAYDEITVPWIIGPSVFRPHLFNKLIKRGFTYKQANKLLFLATKTYDPLISELLDELIRETPGGRGILCLSQRN